MAGVESVANVKLLGGGQVQNKCDSSHVKTKKKCKNRNNQY